MTSLVLAESAADATELDLDYRTDLRPAVVLRAPPFAVVELAEDIALCGGHVSVISSWAGVPGESAEIVIVDLRGAIQDDICNAVGRLAKDRRPSVIVADPDAIDIVSALAERDELRIVIGNSRAERLAAFGSVLNRCKRRVGESGDYLQAEQLRHLAHAVERLARELERFDGRGEGDVLTSSSARGGSVPAFEFPGGLSDTEKALVSSSKREAITGAKVRKIIKARRLRARYFEDSLFADPAWDMLLDLTAARLECTDVSVSSLCIAAHVPPTTALRWIKLMTDKGIFVRRADEDDARRAFIGLSDEAFESMLAYFVLTQFCG